MPLQRRLPKVGFRSKIKATRAEVRLSELAKVDAAVIDLDALKKAGVVPVFAEQAKLILSGEVSKAVTLKGIGATKGALGLVLGASHGLLHAKGSPFRGARHLPPHTVGHPIDPLREVVVARDAPIVTGSPLELRLRQGRRRQEQRRRHDRG